MFSQLYVKVQTNPLLSYILLYVF